MDRPLRVRLEEAIAEVRDEAGRFRLRQRTNAYAVLPPSQWLGYRDNDPPPVPGAIGPPPEPGAGFPPEPAPPDAVPPEPVPPEPLIPPEPAIPPEPLTVPPDPAPPEPLCPPTPEPPPEAPPEAA